MTIFKIKESQFQNILETVESLLYCIWWPSQPDYVKIGYGNIHRPSSSSYTTPFGSNGVLKVWLPSVPFSKTKMFSIEQDLHKKLRNNIDSLQEGGTEVYNISFKRAYFNINQYITTEIKSDFKTFITTISEYKTMIKTYLSRDYIITSVEELLDKETKCDHCHKSIRNKAYKCLAYIEGEPTDTTILMLGSTCIKNYKQNVICIREKNAKNRLGINNIVDLLMFNSSFLRKTYEKKKIKKEFVCSSDLEEEDDKEEDDKTELEHQSDLVYHKEEIGKQIVKFICKDFFKTENFNIKIDSNFIEFYELSFLNFTAIYGLISNCKYFQLSPLTETGFAVKIDHYAYDKQSISAYFKEYRNSEVLSYFEPSNLNEEQEERLLDTNPYIVGFPGTGKSYIMQRIMMDNNDKRILYLTPTYQALESGKSKISQIVGHKIISRVIDNIYMTDTFILPFIKKFRPEIILVDEFAMLNIFHLYKIKKLCIEFNPILKMFGDPYQLPPIQFSSESQYIIKSIFEQSVPLIEIRRQKDDKLSRPINIYLSQNRSNINPDCELFNKAVYSQTEIIDCYNNEYRFLAYTNDTVNEMNSWIYNYKKRTSCQFCLSTIQIGKHIYCENCINQFKFIFDSNLKCNSYEGNKILKYQTTEIANKYKKQPNIFYNGESITIRVNSAYSELFDIIKEKGGNTLTIKKEDLSSLSLKLFYAQTIHKSQGQSIDKVFIVIDKREIESSAIYTAITRTKDYSCLKIAQKIDNYTIIPNGFDNINTDNNIESIIEKDFYIENHPNKLVLRLKDEIDIDNYRQFFKNNKIHTLPSYTRSWVIRNSILENKQKLIEHIHLNIM